MRYIFLCVFALLCVQGLQANNNELFMLDRAKVNNAMNDLNKIETFVTENPNAGPDELLKSGAIDAISFEQLSNPFSINGEPPLGIPSFLWGCVFGAVGIIIVLIMTDKDKNQMVQAVYGCLTSYALIVLFYLVLFAEMGAL